jgi:hypothetical protein
VGDYLLQCVHDPDSGHRADDQDSGSGVGHGQVGLLSGDDLRFMSKSSMQSFLITLVVATVGAYPATQPATNTEPVNTERCE